MNMLYPNLCYKEMCYKGTIVHCHQPLSGFFVVIWPHMRLPKVSCLNAFFFSRTIGI